MSPTNILQLVFIIICIMAFPLALQFWINSRVRGKHLCFIVEKGRPLTVRLLKVVKDDFVRDGKDLWELNPEKMKPVDYPIQFPKILAGFQKGVWSSLLMRGRADPLDWENPPVGALSSKELSPILDPHWLVNLVQGMKEEGKSPKGERMLLYITAGGVAILLIMMFFIITKIGGIQAALDGL